MEKTVWGNLEMEEKKKKVFAKPTASEIITCLEAVSRDPKNLYKMHLEDCPNRPEMIDDDKKLNETIDEILERHKILKEEKKKLKNQFVCPYCQRVFASKNLKHLLGCAKSNPDDLEKLKGFFTTF